MLERIPTLSLTQNDPITSRKDPKVLGFSAPTRPSYTFCPTPAKSRPFQQLRKGYQVPSPQKGGGFSAASSGRGQVRRPAPLNWGDLARANRATRANAEVLEVDVNLALSDESGATVPRSE